MGLPATKSDYDDGYDEGYDKGHDDGWQEGHDEGVDYGIEQGQRKLEGELWKLLYEVHDFMQGLPIQPTDRYRRLNREVQIFLEDHQ